MASATLGVLSGLALAEPLAHLSLTAANTTPSVEKSQKMVGFALKISRPPKSVFKILLRLFIILCIILGFLIIVKFT